MCLFLVFIPVQGRAEADSALIPNDWNIENWYIYTSVFTRHVRPKPYHVNDQNMFAIEAQMQNNWVYGLAVFDSSFGQRSEYFYAGYIWDLHESERWYFKLTGGLLHGYKGEFKDKIPYNGLGTAPAVLPTLGFQYERFVAEFSLGGVSAIIVTTGILF